MFNIKLYGKKISCSTQHDYPYSISIMNLKPRANLITFFSLYRRIIASKHLPMFRITREHFKPNETKNDSLFFMNKNFEDDIWVT